MEGGMTMTTTTTRLPPWRRDWKYAPSERHAVADFAQYCMGSCHGDWAPQTEASYDEVLRDDELYAHYRKQMRRYDWIAWLGYVPA
jgi:hypothetical protein